MVYLNIRTNISVHNLVFRLLWKYIFNNFVINDIHTPTNAHIDIILWNWLYKEDIIVIDELYHIDVGNQVI